MGNLATPQAIDDLTWTGLPKPVVEDASKRITATRSARRERCQPDGVFLWEIPELLRTPECCCPTPVGPHKIAALKKTCQAK